MQNFRAKPGTKLAEAAEPDLDELLWTIAAARLILSEDVHVQAPPNLSPGVYQKLIDARMDDWGGVSPVTPDHVNPEAPWPELEYSGGGRRRWTRSSCPTADYPAWVSAGRWLHSGWRQGMRRRDAEGWRGTTSGHQA